jgi:hypothetical protein
MASVSDFPQWRQPRQGNATGNLRMTAMCELLVVLILRRSALSGLIRRYCFAVAHLSYPRVAAIPLLPAWRSRYMPLPRTQLA